jgi:hypothetical protein
MIHDSLDIERWKATFPLEALRAGSRLIEPDFISGPRDIAILEQLRDEVFQDGIAHKRLTTDVFVWSSGEPARREVTKIGGLPYRSLAKLWPIDISGKPMTFLAQICFCDSRDLVPALPGDVLLIFAMTEEWQHGAYGISWGHADALAFEWAALGDAPLVTAEEIPDTSLHYLPCYGTIYRTWDAEFAPDNLDHPLPDGDAELLSECAVVDGTKISGIASWLDDEDECRLDREEHLPPGEYLCTLASLMLDISEPFALLNLPVPIEPQDGSRYEAWRQSNPLMIADAGLLNFFLDEQGRVRWTGHFPP